MKLASISMHIRCTCVLLSIQSASSHSDIETGNMQTVVQDENIALCLWANLNKNPRFVCLHGEC